MHPIPYDIAELVNDILPSDNRSGGSPLRPRETDNELGKEFINAFFIQYSSGNRLVLTPASCLNLGSTPYLNSKQHGIYRQEHDHFFRAKSLQWLAFST